MFQNRNDLNNHVRRNHQSAVKVKYQNGSVTEVEKGVDDMFKCTCGKKFKLPSSLQRHVKRCNGELVESTQDEREAELVEVNGSELLEDMDVDSNKFIPVDCFGILIS